jgi:hypothetical protein
MIKWLMSKEKKSCELVAKKAIEFGTGFPQYALEDLVKAAVRGGELTLTRLGNSLYLNEDHLNTWLTQRVSPSSIYVSKEDYIRALAQGFRLAILRAGVVVDFDRARKRDFGQRWSDYARGELGEIGFKRFLEEKFAKKTKLEKRVEAKPEEFYSRDVSGVEEEGRWREPRIKISIKATKLGGQWLDLPGAQIERSEAFVLVKAGLSLDHLASFLKDWGILKKLFEYAKNLGEQGFEENETQVILEHIPPLENILVYVSGFAWKEDFSQNRFELKQRRRKTKTLNVVIRGIGNLSSIQGEFEVLGIPAMTRDHIIASSGYLKWKQEEWKELVAKL